MSNFIAKPQVGFVEATKCVFTKAFDYKSRSRRSEFWWGVLFIFIVEVLTSWIPFVSTLVELVFFVLGLSMSVRRLHDTNHSGWIMAVEYILMVLGYACLISQFGTSLIDADFDNAATPLMIIGGLLILLSCAVAIYAFILSLFDSDVSTNKYGESPKYVERLDFNVE